MQADVLKGGFRDAPVDSSRAFRAAMQAMARPGTIQQIGGTTPPAPLSAAAGTLLLTLCDPETAVHLAGPYDCRAVRDWITFHCGAPLTGPETCAFAVGAWPDLQPLDRFPVGSAQYPDRSVTLIVELPALSATGAQLTGPGIRDEAHLSLPETRAFQQNGARFPLGWDAFFCAGDRIAAVPRSTKVGG